MNNTAKRYTFLWSRYSKAMPPANYHFDCMQQVISEKIVRGSIGLEVGCGCGWDISIMAKNNPLVRIIGMDISDGVYVASGINSGFKNVNVIKGSVVDIPLKNNSCDFIYSFGVLHHISNCEDGFLEIARVLKKNSPCFLYLYEDHSENIIKYFSIKVINVIRKLTVIIPPWMLYIICCVMSPVFFIIFSLPAIFFKTFKLTHKLYQKMPFNFGTHLFSLSGDLYDRFATPIEHRFNKKEILELFKKNGFSNVIIDRIQSIAGWVVWGYKA